MRRIHGVRDDATMGTRHIVRDPRHVVSGRRTGQNRAGIRRGIQFSENPLLDRERLRAALLHPPGARKHLVQRVAAADRPPFGAAGPGIDEPERFVLPRGLARPLERARQLLPVGVEDARLAAGPGEYPDPAPADDPGPDDGDGSNRGLGHGADIVRGNEDEGSCRRRDSNPQGIAPTGF